MSSMKRTYDEELPDPPLKRATAASINVDSWWKVDLQQEPLTGASKLVHRCMMNYGWNEKFALSILQGYRNLLEMKALHQDWNDKKVSPPSENIDRMWSEHIRDHVDYISLCQRAHGAMMLRDPEVPLREQVIRRCPNKTAAVFAKESKSDSTSDDCTAHESIRNDSYRKSTDEPTDILEQDVEEDPTEERVSPPTASTLPSQTKSPVIADQNDDDFILSGEGSPPEDDAAPATETSPRSEDAASMHVHTILPSPISPRYRPLSNPPLGLTPTDDGSTLREGYNFPKSPVALTGKEKACVICGRLLRTVAKISERKDNEVVTHPTHPGICTTCVDTAWVSSDNGRHVKFCKICNHLRYWTVFHASNMNCKDCLSADHARTIRLADPSGTVFASTVTAPAPVDKPADFSCRPYEPLQDPPNICTQDDDGSTPPEGYNFPQSPVGANGNETCVMCGKSRRVVSKLNEKEENESVILRVARGVCTACQDNIWVCRKNGRYVKFCTLGYHLRYWSAFSGKSSCDECHQKRKTRDFARTAATAMKDSVSAASDPLSLHIADAVPSPQAEHGQSLTPESSQTPTRAPLRLQRSVRAQLKGCEFDVDDFAAFLERRGNWSSDASQLVSQVQSLTNDEKLESLRGNGKFVFEYDLRLTDDFVAVYEQAMEFSRKFVKDPTGKVFGDLFLALHDYQVHLLPSMAV